MTTTEWLLILALAASTYSVRVIGLFAGQKIMNYAPLKKALETLPGCLLVALIASSLADADSMTWIAASIALIVAILCNHVILTMILSFTSLFLLQTYF